MTVESLARGRTLESEITKTAKFLKELEGGKSLHIGVPYEGGFTEKLTEQQLGTLHTLGELPPRKS